MNKINWNGKEWLVPEGYEFTGEIKFPIKGELYYNEHMVVNTAPINHKNFSYPILRKLPDDPCKGCIYLQPCPCGCTRSYCKKQNYSTPQLDLYSTCPNKEIISAKRETFTLEDLVAKKCPVEGLTYFLKTYTPYSEIPIDVVYTQMQNDGKPKCWFRWFSDNIAPKPAKELKEIELRTAPFDPPYSGNEKAAILGIGDAVYNFLLNAAHQDASWARKIFSDALAKYGYKPKGW